MPNTPALYEKIIRSPEKLSWQDIFRKEPGKHDQRDADYAMIAGTTLDTVASETGMLQKWQRPWLYRKMFLVALAATAIIYTAIFALIFVTGECINACLSLLLFVLPPCVVPVTLMVFFWEMNAPRNISLIELIGYFFTGGVLSILASLFLFEYIEDASRYAYLAPLAEEPGKLIICILFLSRLQKKRGKVYGLTGLAIGAAVGAGFAAFESAQYAYRAYSEAAAQSAGSVLDLAKLAYMQSSGCIMINSNTMPDILVSEIIRNVFAVCGHVLYCAPYSCLVALFMSESRNPLAALGHLSFWLVFAVSFFDHMFWNMGILPLLAAAAISILVLWSTCLYGVRKSFIQIAAHVASGSQGGIHTTPLKIQGITGVHAGICFALTKQEIIIGSDAQCNLNFPVSTSGISPKHCKLIVQNGQLYLADLGSMGGTYLNRTKLHPGNGQILKKGDTFTLGSDDQKFMVV